MYRKRVIVSGAVQGVFFRDTCRATAAAQGVHGWVRNLPDNSVEAVFEGETGAVEQLVDWAHEGPPTAGVEHVEVYGEEPEGLDGFEIRETPPSGLSSDPSSGPPPGPDSAPLSGPQSGPPPGPSSAPPPDQDVPGASGGPSGP